MFKFLPLCFFFAPFAADILSYARAAQSHARNLKVTKQNNLRVRLYILFQIHSAAFSFNSKGEFIYRFFVNSLVSVPHKWNYAVRIQLDNTKPLKTAIANKILRLKDRFNDFNVKPKPNVQFSSISASVSSSFPELLLAQQGARASRQVPAGVPAESRTLTFPLVYTLPPLTGLRDGSAARRRREGDLSKVYPAAPAVPGEPAGAPDLMRDPVELPERRRLSAAPRVAEGAGKEAAGCVGVCRCVSDCCVVSWESHARCLRAEPRSRRSAPLISSHVSLLRLPHAPNPPQNSDYDI